MVGSGGAGVFVLYLPVSGFLRRTLLSAPGRSALFLLLLAALLLAVAGPAEARPRQYDRGTLVTRPVGAAQKATLVRTVQRDLAHRRLRSLSLAAPSGETREVVRRGGDVGAVGNLSLPVLAAVSATAGMRSWGGERDLLVRVRGRGSYPVTLIYSPRGDLVVSQGGRLGETPPKSSAASLGDDFSLGRIRSSGRRWSAAELGVVHQALSQLSKAELGGVKGLDLVRTPASGGNPRHAGRYKKDRRGARILVFDRAFAGDRYGFFGSVSEPHPASINTLLHEVGHALADWPARLAWQRVEKQQRRQKRVYKEYKASYRSYRKAYRRYRVAFAGGKRAQIAKREAQMKEHEAHAQQLAGRLKGVQAEQKKLNRSYRRIQRHSPVLKEYRKALAGRRGPTAYGRTSIHESFAESFALYRGDPQALLRILPKVHAWFERGGHLSWR